MSDPECPPLQDGAPRYREETAAPADGSPRTIGKYCVLGLIGRGGMGAVFHAFDPHLERDVALKVMLPQFADQPEHKLRFEREARAVARMMHPNVVTVFDLGYHTDGSPYIVMELLKGRDLAQVLREGSPPDLRRSVSIALQVLEGLGHAHRVGIVHRDIKPGNVFLVDSGNAKIMDFGIARVGAEVAAASSLVIGTADYMSPEQVEGTAIDARTDLWSVGCMLAEMVGQHPPFEADRPMATLRRIIRTEPTLHLPEDADGKALGRVLRRALEKDPKDRFASAAEFAAALRSLLDRPSYGTASIAATETPPGLDDESLRAVPLAMSGSQARRTAPSSPLAAADPTPLFRLLREIYVGGKSGHLHLTSGHERRRLRILGGRIVDGSSDVQGERLGDVLVRYGLLDQADLERAVAVVLRERKKLGRVLGEMGLLDRPRMEDAIGLHVREILFVMLERPSASFHFEEVFDSLIDGDLVCRLSTGEVILEATRRVQDPALVRRGIGDAGRVLVLSQDPLLRAQSINLTPVDGFVLSRIDGTLSAREILSLIPLPAEDVERSLFGLLCTGMVDHAETRPLTRPLPRGTGKTAPARAGTEPLRVTEPGTSKTRPAVVPSVSSPAAVRKPSPDGARTSPLPVSASPAPAPLPSVGGSSPLPGNGEARVVPGLAAASPPAAATAAARRAGSR